jgi:carbamate kinase
LFLHKLFLSPKMLSPVANRARAQAAQYAIRAYSATSPNPDRIVVAVGGNALQRRGERLTIENMLKAAAEMAPTIAALAKEHEVVLTHGNGPQVGELALERSAAS